MSITTDDPCVAPQRRAHRRVWLVVVVVCVASAMTVSNLAAISDQRETAQPAAYRPMVGYGTSDLYEIAVQHGHTVRRRFLFHLDLKRIAPGAHVTMFPDAGFHEERLFGIGDLAALEVAEYDAELTKSEERQLRSLATSVGETRLRGGVRDYVIVADPSESELAVYLGQEGTLFVVSSHLINRETTRTDEHDG